VEHGADALASTVRWRQHEADGGILDALLRSTDALRHRRFGHQERIGDLRRREPTHCAQGERDGGRARECGMAAHEQQHEGVVLLYS
jgi:hypothetical protein